MIRLTSIFSLGILIFLSPCFGQEKRIENEIEHQIANDLNRIQTLFMIANNGIYGSRNMEPTSDQKEAFTEIQKDRESIQSELASAMETTDGAERIAKLSVIKESMDDLEERLTSDILLPHQVEALKREEFLQLLRKFKGDFARVVETHYGRKFGMTANQKKLWKKLTRKQEVRKRELNQEYNEKLQNLEEESRAELATIFNAEQLKMIRDISGIELSKSSTSEIGAKAEAISDRR